MRSDDREAAELDRLLYVAATRAREKLILNGYIRLKQDGHPGRPGGWLNKISGPDALGLTGTQVPHEEEGASAIRLDLRVGGTRVPCTIYEPRYLWRRRPLKTETAEQPPAVLTPSLLPAVPWFAEDVDQRTVERERTPPRRVWRVVPAVKRPRAPARVVGSLVHEALAAWRFPDGTFERWVKARARGLGITDPRQLVDAAAEAKKLLNRFRAHWLYREMNRADRRLHEVPYSILVDGRPDSGRIDALVLQDGLWTIAEFKTDKVGNETGFWKTVKEGNYLDQAHKYLAAAESLLGQRPRFILCMLDYAGTVVLHALKGGTLQRLS
jgi:ATP-dependent exoDNAse (exonuclease V) beta subunit